MQSPISVNAHLSYIKDYPRFLNRMRVLNPRILLAYVDKDDHMPKIEALRTELPNTLIIGRVYNEHDGNFYGRPEGKDDKREWIAAPLDFLGRWGKLGKKGMSLNALNEPGTSYDPDKPEDLERIKRLVDWTAALLEAAYIQDISITAPNFGVGHPGLKNDQWDERFDPILKALSKYRKLHILGLHEYYPEPDRIGRFMAAVKRCAALGIQAPSIALTEWGSDSGKDEPTRNGYKSRGWSGEEYARKLIEMAEGVYRPYLDSGVLLGMCVFSYGNSGGWSAFDVEEDKGFWDTLLSWKYQPDGTVPDVTVEPPPAPVPVPSPTPIPQPKPNWKQGFSAMELKMIAASQYYAADPSYPDPGSHLKKLVAKMAGVLDKV